MRPSILARFAAPGARAREAAATVKANRRSGKSDSDTANPQVLEQFIELARPVLPPSPLPEAERMRRRRLMINYGRLKRAQFLESERKVNRFLVSKWSAMDALPNERRIEAMRPREERPPRDRPLWTHTPPIPNYNPGALTGKRRS